MGRPFNPDYSPSPCRRAGGTLVNCADCGREISLHAFECVHCGRPRSLSLGRAFWLVALVAGIAAVAWLAIPSRVVTTHIPVPIVHSGDDAWDAVMRGRPRGCGFLGVMLKTVPQSAVVSFVAPDSPAQEAGLRAGDVVASIDGRPVEDYRACLSRIWAKRPGERMTLTLARGTTQWTLDVALGRHPTD